jgi:uncharacterized membrane protein
VAVSCVELTAFVVISILVLATSYFMGRRLASLSPAVVDAAHYRSEIGYAKLIYILYLVAVGIGVASAVFIIVNVEITLLHCLMVCQVHVRDDPVRVAVGWTGVLGVFISCAAGVFLAYVSRRGAPTWISTHYRLQIRTFWIDAILTYVLGRFLLFCLFGLFVLFWWMVRCVKGLKLVSLGAAYENPGTSLW